MGVYFISSPDIGGWIQNVIVENIVVEASTCIGFTNNYYSPNTTGYSWRGAYLPTLFRNYTVSNIFCKKAIDYGIYIVGMVNLHIQDVSLHNIRIDYAGISDVLDYIDNLTIINVIINEKNIIHSFPHANSCSHSLSIMFISFVFLIILL